MKMALNHINIIKDGNEESTTRTQMTIAAPIELITTIFLDPNLINWNYEAQHVEVPRKRGISLFPCLHIAKRKWKKKSKKGMTEQREERRKIHNVRDTNIETAAFIGLNSKERRIQFLGAYMIQSESRLREVILQSIYKILTKDILWQA